MNFIYLKPPFKIEADEENKIIIIEDVYLTFFGLPYIANKLKKYPQTIKVANCALNIANSMLANKYNFDYIIVDTNDILQSKLNSLANKQKFFKNIKQLKQHLQGNKNKWKLQAMQ